MPSMYLFREDPEDISNPKAVLLALDKCMQDWVHPHDAEREARRESR